MAASDTQEGGVPAAGGAGLDDAPDPQRGLLAAGGQTASDHPPVVPGASDEEEGERGEEDASEAPQGLEAVGKQTASDHAPVAAQAAEYAEGTNGVVQAEQGVAPEPEEKLEVEDGGWEEDGDATEQDGEGEGEEDGEEDGEGDAVTPTDLPFAPTSKEPLDASTTVNRSCIISLIRNLIPKGPNLEKGFSDKLCEDSDDRESTPPQYKDPWEACGCILWDHSASEPEAEIMIKSSILEVLLENLRVADSSRVKEVCLGIMGNLACHESLVDAIFLEKGLITTVVDQLFLDDINCLSETFRLLAAIVRSRASVSLVEALLRNEILSRMLWILGNTTNLTLLGKSIDFISTAIDVQEGIIQPLLKAGLVDHVVGLLKAEIERSLEGKLDRSCILSIILHFLEELSTIQGISEMMSSSDRLMEALVSMIKSPDNQLFDDTTAVDSVISLIHNIIPESSNLDKGFSDNQNANYDDRESTWGLPESSEEQGFPEERIIRYGRFKRMSRWNEHSWHLCKYKDVDIAPTHFRQGEFKTCQFCAAAKTTEMNIRN